MKYVTGYLTNTGQFFEHEDDARLAEEQDVFNEFAEEFSLRDWTAYDWFYGRFIRDAQDPLEFAIRVKSLQKGMPHTMECAPF